MPQLRYPQLKRSQPGVERAVAVAITPGHALAIALVASSTDQTFYVRFHQQLKHRFGHSAQKIPFTSLLQQLG